jgi:sugar lactone lactonase YvrE
MVSTVTQVSAMHTATRQGSVLRNRAGFATVVALLGLGSTSCVFAQVPAAVATTQTSLSTVGGIGAGRTAVDGCGNVYINPTSGGNLVEVLASTGAVVTVSANSNTYNNGTGLAIDAAKANLYYPTSSQWYGSAFTKVPLTNCVAGAAQVVGNNLGSLSSPIYYYGTASDIAADAAGNVFFTLSSDGTGVIIEETTAGTPVQVQASWPNSLTSLAVDASDNLYFTDGSVNVYELSPPYTAKATSIGSGFSGPVGVTVDAFGNLLVADGKSSIVYEIPYESTGLNAAHQFRVASVATTNAVAADLSGNFYLSNNSGNPIAVRQGTALANTAVGSSATATLNYIFNTAVTPATISVKSGTATSTAFASTAGGTCAALTAYTAGQTCTLNVKFSPTVAGQQRAAVVLSNTAGTALNLAFVRGIGLSPAVTIDPGTLTALGSGFKTPSGIAVGSDGTTFVIDSGANTVTMFAAGATTGTAVGTGTFTLSSPSGVAVDGAGDVYIADTGNSRIIEVPIVNGALSSANSVAYTAALKSPTGLATGGNGNLYIADTGNNRVLFIFNQGGTLDFAAPRLVGSGYVSPSSVALDANGNIFVADAGNNAVDEFAAPLGSATQVKVVSGLSNPTSVATDASGSLFVADAGSANVYRYPNNAGIFGARAIVSNGVINPAGVAIDATGNLYITDSTNSVVDKLARVQASVLFGVVNVTSTSSPATAVVSASGNQAVTLPSPSYTVSGNTAAGFAVTSDGCGSAGGIAVGASCSIVATFTPPIIEVNAEEDLTLKGNATADIPKIALIGTGEVLRPTTVSLVLTTPTSGSISAGEAVSFTATINTGGATFVPGGSVQFSVNGTQVATVKVANGAAVLSLPNGLPAGLATITAAYTGDSVNYGGSSETITETVLALPTMLTFVITSGTSGAIIYNNPYSTNDSSANAQGPSIMLTATLNGVGSTIAGGTVSFYSGSTASPTLLGIMSVNASNTASLTISSLRAGTTNVVENNSFASTYNLFAVYSGDTTYGASTSVATPITIVAPPLCALGANPTCLNVPGTTAPATGANFSLSPAVANITAPYTVGGQQSNSATLTATSYGGWTGLLTFTCTGLPAYATCNPYPGVPQVNDSTVAAPQPLTQVLFTINTNVTPPNTSIGSFVWWMGGFTGLCLLVLRSRAKGGLRQGLTLMGLVLLLAGTAATMTACGGGTSFVTTPKGTSTITVKVNAAQLNLSSSAAAGSVYANDLNTPSFQVVLTVQ